MRNLLNFGISISSELKKRGQLFQRWRHFAGYTARGLAKKLGVSAQTIYNWEAGSRIPNDKLEKLIALGWSKDEAFIEYKKPVLS